MTVINTQFFDVMYSAMILDGGCNYCVFTNTTIGCSSDRPLGLSPPINIPITNPGLRDLYNVVSNCSFHCNLGYYSRSGVWPCDQCPRGTYGSVYNNTLCPSCKPGSYSENEGSINCTLCPAGYYNEDPGGQSSFWCTQCPPGSFNTILGATNCTLCAHGEISPGLSVPCSPCPEGNAATVGNCFFCGSGNLVVNKTSCGNCGIMLTSTNYNSCDMLSVIAWIILGAGVVILLAVVTIIIMRCNRSQKEYKPIQ